MHNPSRGLIVCTSCARHSLAAVGQRSIERRPSKPVCRGGTELDGIRRGSSDDQVRRMQHEQANPAPSEAGTPAGSREADAAAAGLMSRDIPVAASSMERWR